MKSIIKNMLQKFGYELVPIYTLPLHIRSLRQFAYVSRRFENASPVEGAIVECGVGYGRTLLYFTYLIEQEKKGRKIWGFDSFEGFPEPTKEDDSARKPKKGDWGDTSEAMVLGQIRRAGIAQSVIDSRVTLVKGFFPGTFSEYDKAPIALLHVDVDLYQSYVDALNFFYPFVVEGGVIMFDEYQEEKWPGATKAIDDFCAKTKQVLSQDQISKKYFIIKKSA